MKARSSELSFPSIRLPVLLWILGAMLLGAGPIRAEKKVWDPDEAPWDRAYVQFGAFLTALDSSFAVGTAALGIELSAEGLLGLEETSSVFRLDAGGRLTKSFRHSLGFSWFSLDRNATNTLGQPIELPGGGTIPAGFTVSSIFDIDIFKLRYDYSALLDDRVDLKVGGGLYVMPIKVGLGEVGAESVEESITAPLPVLSFGFTFVLSPKWHLRQSLDFLYLSIADFQGGVLDLNVVAERDFTKKIGFGFGFETLDIQVESESTDSYPGVDFVGNIQFRYRGFQVYIRGQF